MISLETFRKLALDLPDVEESVHFHLVVFGVRKKNFASFDPRTGGLSLKLQKSDPKRLDGIGRGVLTIAPGKYGEHGWTTADLARMDKPEFVNLLNSAHAGVAVTTATAKVGKTPKA